jgi:hypothetical protein
MNSYLFKEMEEDALRQEEALQHSRQAAPPPEARGWQLRVVGGREELEEGWNEPIPEKRDWVVHHYYEAGRSLCSKYSYTTQWPPKPHFQIDNPSAPYYREAHTDWLCKICLIHRLGKTLPPMHAEETRVVSIFSYIPFQIYVGQAQKRYGLPASKWANPDRSAARKQPRQARAEYRAHILTQPALVASLPELRGKILSCDCRSHTIETFCHGEVLVELAEIGHNKAVARR